MKILKNRKGGCLFSLFKLLLVFLAIVFVAVYFFSGIIVESAISTVGNMAGVKMDAKASISWSNFEFALNDFYIENPQGYSQAKAISFKQALFRPDITLGGLEGSAPFIIDEIKISGISLLMEKNGILSPFNLSEISDKFKALVPQSEGGTKSDAQEQAQQQTKPERKFIIRKLVFENGSISFVSKGEIVTQTLPSFTVTNLGGQNGSTATVLVGEIMMQLTNQALKSGANAVIDVTQKEGSNAIDNITNSFKNLLK